MADTKTQKQIKILSAITRIHQSVGVNLELEEVARILAGELTAIVGCSGCAILLLEGRRLRILAQRNFADKLSERNLYQSFPAIKKVLETKRGICTGDVQKSDAKVGIPSGYSARSLMCSPVLINDEVKGIIHLDAPQREAFDEQDLQFVELLAREISIAVERSMLRSRVRALSTLDSLTGCYNRRRLEEDIEAEVARAKRYEKPLSLFLIGVDLFKKYNEFHGHSMGDLLLTKLGDVLKRNVRNIDRVYRYGGEEFILLLPETGKWKALTVARRLHKII
jgi:GGDEF domain-containing protein